MSDRRVHFDHAASTPAEPAVVAAMMPYFADNFGNPAILYGPKGVGALYVRKGTPLSKLLHGGGKESGCRAGTCNVPGIVGLGKAAEIAARTMTEDAAHSGRLRDRVIAGVTGNITHVRLNGHPERRLPNNACFSIAGVEGEALLLLLERAGFSVSSGSACSSNSVEPSHVLVAMGIPTPLAHGSLRVTVGRDTGDPDIDRFLATLSASVERLRRISPVGTQDGW